jgi:type IV pilus assembly protein PilM
MDQPIKPKNAIALEIDDSAVRLACIGRHRNALELDSWNSIELPQNAVSNGLILKPEIVRAAILSAIQTAHGRHSTPRYVALTIPEPHVFVTSSLIQDPGDVTLETIESTTLQNVPFPIEDVQIDWSTIDKTPQGSLVLIGAIPKDIIQSYVELIHGAGLIPLIIEPESAALARAIFGRPLAARNALVIDFGQAVTTILVCQNGVVRFSSSSNQFSGSELTQAISNHLELTMVQAEKAKRLFGLLPKQSKGEVRKVLLPGANLLIKRIEEIEAYVSSHISLPLKRVTDVILTGGGSQLPGMIEFLGAELRLPVTAPLPSEIHKISIKPGLLTDDSQRSLCTVLGSALRLTL